ncbi:MAG: DUF5931 domain-containing protein [Nocardioides sp.]|uniref:MacS family sensor histidine kinase n=1 Tax=Nocardioides sp. TaxID=35761 RepID=UPI0039E438DC
MEAESVWRSPAAVAVADRLFRALAVLRVVVLVNAIGLNLWRAQNFEHPTAGVVVVLALVAWTAFVVWAYGAPARRASWLLIADLAVAVAAIAASPIVKGDAMRATIPGFWVMGALLAWAIHWRWQGGLIAATVLSVADWSVRPEFTQNNYGNTFLLMIGGPIVGYMAGSLQQMAAERDLAERRAAAAAERARLARAVHDGVLQVLSLIQRRGGEQGGDLADLGRLAGEQEEALRSLIRQQDAVGVPGGASSRDAAGAAPVDLAAELERLALVRPPVVSVATPGGPVMLPADRALELVAVARACLDNVARHVGNDAAAWLLLEEVGDEIVLSVRDEGPGIPEGRLAAAEAEGRLGVSQSIRGRIVDLGGRATLSTGSYGTEWELTIPRSG